MPAEAAIRSIDLRLAASAIVNSGSEPAFGFRVRKNEFGL
jgi:hypothetical protein